MLFSARSVGVLWLAALVPLHAADIKSNAVVKAKPAAAIPAAPLNSANPEGSVSNNQNAINAQMQGEAGPPVNGAIGVLEFTASLPRAWVTAISSPKVKLALESDGNDMLPTFIFENPTGGVIYGTWRAFREGQIFSAEKIGAGLPGFSSEWGIKKEDIYSKVSRTNKEMEYAVLIASGPGDGVTFAASGKKRMTAIWVDIPVAYKDKMDVRSGLAGIYYRGPVEGYPEAQKIIDGIMEGLNPTRVELITISEFRRLSAPKQNDAQPIPAVSPKPAPPIVSGNPKEANSPKNTADSEKTLERLERVAERLESVLEELKKGSSRSWLDNLRKP